METWSSTCPRGACYTTRRPHAHTHIDTHIDAHIDAHAHTHTVHTHIRIHTHTHMHTHTHTHTLERPLERPLGRPLERPLGTWLVATAHGEFLRSQPLLPPARTAGWGWFAVYIREGERSLTSGEARAPFCE